MFLKIEIPKVQRPCKIGAVVRAGFEEIGTPAKFLLGVSLAIQSRYFFWIPMRSPPYPLSSTLVRPAESPPSGPSFGR